MKWDSTNQAAAKMCGAEVSASHPKYPLDSCKPTHVVHSVSLSLKIELLYYLNNVLSSFRVQ